MRVLAAMSGGVDSAVAAARAVDAGHDVVGRAPRALARRRNAPRRQPRLLHDRGRDGRPPRGRSPRHPVLRLGLLGALPRRRHRGLRRRVPRRPHAEPLHALQRADQVRRRAREGARPRLRRRVHRSLRDPARRGIRRALELHRASDAAKDQSYVLGVLTAEQLAHTLFPLGETPSKALVRAEAEARGLTVAHKPDSHDICFIPDGDTRGWLAERVGAERRATSSTGPVRSWASHEGAHAFTVGQRRGLALGVPAARRQAAVRARGASGLEHGRRRPEGGARDRRDRGRAVHLGRAPRPTASDFACHVQIRAHADPVPARAVHRRAASSTVHPTTPLDGVAPGPDGGALRRHARARAVHDRPHGLGGSRRRLSPTAGRALSHAAPRLAA